MNYLLEHIKTEKCQKLLRNLSFQMSKKKVRYLERGWVSGGICVDEYIDKFSLSISQSHISYNEAKKFFSENLKKNRQTETVNF